jgi:parvulin-like peptidyl-prolyl isomerase
MGAPDVRISERLGEGGGRGGAGAGGQITPKFIADQQVKTAGALSKSNQKIVDQLIKQAQGFSMGPKVQIPKQDEAAVYQAALFKLAAENLSKYKNDAGKAYNEALKSLQSQNTEETPGANAPVSSGKSLAEQYLGTPTE